VLGCAPAERLPSFLADIFLLTEEIFVPSLTPVEYAHRYAGFYPRFDRSILDKLLTDFALPADRNLSAFSHGQKKKFLLAFGIATNARLLIMDEPTNGLDIPGKTHFRRALINHFSPERSFLISTHQVHDLQGLIDSVMVVADGSLLLHAALDTLSARLQVELEEQRPDDALYVEETLEGYRVIRENTSGAEADLDLELLFGLATTASAQLRQILARGATTGVES
jgi:ABC-2 type transport system ATP-binding protein